MATWKITLGMRVIKLELSLILLMTDIYLHYTLTSVPTSEQSPVSLQGQLVHEIIAVSLETKQNVNTRCWQNVVS